MLKYFGKIFKDTTELERQLIVSFTEQKQYFVEIDKTYRDFCLTTRD